MSAPATDEEKFQTADELAKEKWESSGLTSKMAERLKFKALSQIETKALGGNFHGVASLLIPYFDLKGNPTKFFRARYLAPLPGFAGVVEKPQRYAQAAGTINEVYLPPLFTHSWEKIANDPEHAVLFTEGELKAAAGCAAGLATIGLGGVDVWRSSKRGIELLPPLDQFTWEGRSVAIVFDSDAATNPHVVRAQRSLAKEMLSRGARPSIVSLPQGKDGRKVGLDDYLLKRSAKELLKLVTNATPFPEADALWKLNEEVVYIKDPGIVVERETGLRMRPDRFVRDAYANRHFLETTESNGKVSVKKKPLAPRWMAWESRFEVPRVTYEPGSPRIVRGGWNAWEGWGCEPKKGDVSNWRTLLDHIFKGQPASRKWFEQWCAYPIQHPGTKLYTAALLWGTAKGTGKTIIAYSLMKIYGKNAVEIKNRDLKRSFNSWADNRQFVYGDEISAGEARVDAEWLKGLITEHHVTINTKFIPEYVIPDRMNYLFASNRCDALFVERGDRRYFIHEVTEQPMARIFYEKYDDWLHGDGPSALFHHLLNVDLTGFNPREHAPETEGKLNMVYASMTEVGAWIEALKVEPERLLVKMGLGDKIPKECDIYTTKMLLRAFDPEGKGRLTEIGMGKAMAMAGIRTLNGSKPVRTYSGLKRLYAVRNVDKWINAKPLKIAQEFDRFFGPGTQRFD